MILAPGSRGDVQPYIALGQALLGLGHRCTIVTTLDHEALVRGYGVDVATIPINVATELARIETNRAVEGGGVIASFRQFTAIATRSARALAEVSLAAASDADVIVTNFGTTITADGIGKKLGLPVVQAFNVPLTSTSAFPGALFPGLDRGGVSRRLSHRLTRAALWLTARTSANAACMEVLGAPSAPRWPGTNPGLLPGRVLYGFSEALLPRPADWSSDVDVTGFWSVQEPSTFVPPPELVRFLDAGPPPVCIGFGSMGTDKPDVVGGLVIEAAQAAGQRVVVLSGWAGLRSGSISDDVVVLEGVPHSWLYPRCAAVVHHGGAGTTAAAVCAGVPAVIVPFHGDQPFWAARVHKLGLGPAPIPRRRLTAARLASALTTATTDDAMRARAAAVGQRVRVEQGAVVAATAIAALQQRQRLSKRRTQSPADAP